MKTEQEIERLLKCESALKEIIAARSLMTDIVDASSASPPFHPIFPKSHTSHQVKVWKHEWQKLDHYIKEGEQAMNAGMPNDQALRPERKES